MPTGFAKLLDERGITVCIPGRSNRKTPIGYDRILYRQRPKIENMFGRLKSLPARRRGTGGAYTPAMTDAHIHPCPPSALQPT